MKKVLLALLISLLFVTNVYAANSIEIKSIELDSKSETTTELNKPKFNGLEMNYDLRFKSINDFAKYKIIIKNNTSNDYNVSENTSFKLSDYVTYKYEASQTIKSNSETTVNIVITYSNAVDSSSYVNGVFDENNKAILELRDEEGNIVNPKTGSINKALILGVVAVLSTVSLLFLMNKKSAFFVLVFFLCLVPIVTRAVEELKVTMNVKVQISIRPTYRVFYPLELFEYKKIDDLDIVRITGEFHKTDEEGVTNTTGNSEIQEVDPSTCLVIYLNSVSEENKKIACSEVILLDKTLYEEGDSVTVKEIPSINADGLNLDESDDVEILSNNSVLIRNIESISKMVDEWYYYCGANYGCDKDTELNIMKFNPDSIIENKWVDQGIIKVSANNKFIMPAHTVMFSDEKYSINN